MFNLIKYHRNLTNKKLKIEKYSRLIDNQFMLWDLSLSCANYWCKDYSYRTKNYLFRHKELNWSGDRDNGLLKLIWVVIPKTIDNSRSLAAGSRLHHGMHPDDWIIKEGNDYLSLPPDRLIDEILEELKATLINMPLHIEPKPIYSRFEILDL